MARTNFNQAQVLQGDDFTRYPLGAFSPYGNSGNYLGPQDIEGKTTPIGTFSIVSGIEPNKKVLKAAFSNPTQSGKFGSQWLWSAEPNVSQPDPTRTFGKIWFRTRFQFASTCFTTGTTIPVFSGQKILFIAELLNSFYNLQQDNQVMNTAFQSLQNNSTTKFYIEAKTTQQDLGTSTIVSNTYDSADCWPSNVYQDGQFHDFIVYWDGEGPNLILKVWVDSNPIPIINTSNPVIPKMSLRTWVPRDPLLYMFLGLLAQSAVPIATDPANDIVYLSMWEMLDAKKFVNPYVVVIDPVTQVFNTYETVQSTGYQVYDENGIPIIFKFITNSGQAIPQVQFVDESLKGPITSIPMIGDGDWVDVVIDPNGSLLQRFRYLSNQNVPQTFNIDITRASPTQISVNRNLSNPQIHTTPANNWSLRDDRRNKDLNPLGYLVGNNRPTTTETKGERRRRGT